jgi:subtilase family serine protease
MRRISAIHQALSDSRAARLRPRKLRLEFLESRSLLTALGLDTAATGVSVQDVLAEPSGVSPASTGSSNPVGLTPSQIASYYGLNNITFSSSSGTVVGNGSGVTIAIVDAYYVSNIQSELATFDAALGISAPPSFTVAFPYGQPSAAPVETTSGWGAETALDVEWAHALAPGANILLVETPVGDIYTGAAYAAQQPGVAAVSMSWGTAETPNETASDSDFVTPTGHTGVVFLAASGDAGAPGLYPAMSPNVLAVGGTQFVENAQGTITGETGWDNSGGGISQYETPQPAYQKGVVTQSSTYRTIPDVSSNAGSAMALYDSYDLGTSGWEDLAGTSFGTPSWAALIAIADQGAIAAGGTPLSGSQASSALYNLFSQTGSESFNEITTGNNGYPAGPGYNLVTGLGSPQAGTVIAGLSGNIATPTPAAPSGAINTTAPTFQWSAVSGAVSYQLVVYDQATDAETLNFDVTSGTSYTAPIGTFLPGHSYRWQISAIEANGTSSALSSVITFNVLAVGVPTLIAPAAGASVYTATPTFQWSAVTGAASYNLEVIDTAAPGSPVIDAVVNSTSDTPTTALAFGHNYSWYVSAIELINGVEYTGNASISATLSVMQLGTPTPISPSNNALVSTTPVFSWSSVSGAANYVLTLTDLTANTTLAPIQVTGTSYQPSTPLTLGDNLQWQVQAVDSSGDVSPLSSAQGFTVTDAPTVTGATTPQNVQTTTGLVVTPSTVNSATVTSFLISGITGGALFLSDGTTSIASGTYITVAQAAAGLEFTPSMGQLANGSFNVQASTTADASGLTGSVATATITVTPPVAHTPTVTGATTLENAQTTSGLVITPNALDGAIVTNYQITGISGGALYLSDGTTPVVSGQFITAAQGAAGLRFTPTTGSTTSGGFTVQASTSSNTAGLGGSTVAATISVTPVIFSHISSVTALPARTSLTSFTVSWSGSDAAGIADYDIYESVDGGAFTPWLTATTQTSATFTAQLGHSYGFYSTAHDNSGAVEESHGTADTTIVTTPTPWQNPVNPLDVLGTGGQIVPADALAVINALNLGQAGQLPASQPANSYFLDVLGENFLAPIDALRIIDYLNLTPTAVVSPSGVSAAVASTTVGSPAPAVPSEAVSSEIVSAVSTVTSSATSAAVPSMIVSSAVAAPAAAEGTPAASETAPAVAAPVNDAGSAGAVSLAGATAAIGFSISSQPTIDTSSPVSKQPAAFIVISGNISSQAPGNLAAIPDASSWAAFGQDQSFAKLAVASQRHSPAASKTAAIDAVLEDPFVRWIDD